MKRSAALQQLSRDHHQALQLALSVRRLERPVSADRLQAMSDKVIQTMAVELEPHFQNEEKRLLPLLPADGNAGPLIARTLEDHRCLRQLVAELTRQADLPTLLEFAERLHAHVRFEERELFAFAERHLDENLPASTIARPISD